MYHSFFDENVYFAKQSPFFSVRTCDNTTSPNIGGTNAWAVPPSQFFGGIRPPVPLGLRPWEEEDEEEEEDKKKE